MKTVDEAARFFMVDALDRHLHQRTKSKLAEKALEIMRVGWPAVYDQLSGPYANQMRTLTQRYPGVDVRVQDAAGQIALLMVIFQDVERR
ncbi:hypothetical protein [Comamonas sp. JUb58]|uniref:hypothetical protein n=1 Tax=Comamonas sp. JUb58 TaxID=2485114 RepID=UPI00105C7106|nr:hypothetical protein [Comamonas sp. JUb58]